MSQKIINVGTVANDGTGDTIRGAFTNVNANFTEVYGNITTLESALASIDSGQNTAISAAYITANAAFDVANAANLLATTVGVNANLYSTSIGGAGNAYATAVGASSNAYIDSIALAGNNYIVSVATAGNTYASILAANNAAGANGWSNTISITVSDWANTKFDTFSNTAYILNTAINAYAKANSALPNGAVVLDGSLTANGIIYDVIGPVREKASDVVDYNFDVRSAQSVVIANNSNTIVLNVVNDNNFLLLPTVGAKIEIYQYGSGQTTIAPKDGSVTILSSNNWANIAGQYLSVSIVKVQANTWILSGNLKA